MRWVMPWQATGPGDLTLLTARGRRLTKLITAEAIHGYDDAALFSVDAVRLDGVEDIAELLQKLAPRSDTCAVRAALKDAIEPYAEIRCRIHDRPGQPARFAEVPRSWVMIDLEPGAAPGVDPTDRVMVGGWLRRRLPRPFQLARCSIQLSSGAGIKPGLRAHLFYWLDRPLVGAELERWLRGVDGHDDSTFRPRQFHYTASPVFAGIDDPCRERIAVLPGLAEVAVPDLAPERPRQAFAPISFAGPRAGGAWRLAEVILRDLSTVPAGRRRRPLARACCRLLELVVAGELDLNTAVGRIKGVARPWGDLAEVDRILEWAWQRVQLQPRRLKR
jgi:hypothetical protein